MSVKTDKNHSCHSEMLLTEIAKCLNIILKEINSTKNKNFSPNVQLCNKYGLTIQEAAEYTGLGQNKIREIIREDGGDIVLKVGRKNLIKRDKLEKYLNARLVL